MTATKTPAGPSTWDLDAVRTGPWWQAFTGLVPVLVMVPILLLHAYALGISVAVAGSALVVAYHLRRGQGITSLDVLALTFAAANLVLYFGFDSTLLIEHLDAVFYALLAGQSATSLVAVHPGRHSSPAARSCPTYGTPPRSAP